MPNAGWILIAAVAAVGVFHTLVPDHWAPIAVLARQRGWTPAQTARAAAGAGLGHTVSTLVIAVVAWFAGAALAARVGHLVDELAGVALIAFGVWVVVGSLREVAEQGHGHVHLHRHEGGLVHSHGHTHGEADAHEVDGNLALAPPLHEHEHPTSGRMALLLIVGSSPMIEGIPAFFAAARYGTGLIAVMALVFAAATIGTYVVLCTVSSQGFSKLQFGPLERYGEAISGGIIALIGITFLAFFH